MSVEVNILCFQEEEILPFALRHYSTFADSIILHDALSQDRSREIAAEFGCKIVNWQTDGLDDSVSKKVKEDAVMNCAADWCITCDADELVYFPEGAGYSLGSYDAQRVAIVKPHGFEMVSDIFPTGTGQLYDEVKHAGVDDVWYSKCALVAPKRIASIVYAAGAHQCWATLRDGTKWDNRQDKTEPACYLLHCKHLGPVERIAKKYDIQRTRLSARNVREKWGNFKPGIVHSKEKRDAIMKTVRQVIA